MVGASGALGGEIAEVLRGRGADVVTAGRSTDLDVAIDLADPTAGESLVTFARRRHGRLDGVVIATGVVAFGGLTETRDDVVEEVFLLDAIGPLWLAARVLPALRERRGFLVAITGVVAEAPAPGMAAYSGAKAGLSAALAALRKEERRGGVLVCDARPPHTETGLAGRPIAGTAPTLPRGLSPRSVAERIVAAVENDEPMVAAAAFG